MSCSKPQNRILGKMPKSTVITAKCNDIRFVFVVACPTPNTPTAQLSDTINFCRTTGTSE